MALHLLFEHFSIRSVWETGREPCTYQPFETDGLDYCAVDAGRFVLAGRDLIYSSQWLAATNWEKLIVH